jgi:hypothetical protein
VYATDLKAEDETSNAEAIRLCSNYFWMWKSGG